MKIGFSLFDALAEYAVYEVFPSASYRLLDDDSSFKVSIRTKGLAGGPKDMLDAYIAAITVREFVHGHGQAVGGGDGLGEIVLPRKVKGARSPVHDWPPELFTA